MCQKPRAYIATLTSRMAQTSLSSDLKIVSLNAKGLNHPIKRRKTMDYLAKADKIRARWVGEDIMLTGGRQERGSNDSHKQKPRDNDGGTDAG